MALPRRRASLPAVGAGGVGVLFETHQAYLRHGACFRPPERPARLAAVRVGLQWAGVEESLLYEAPREATREELERVHAPDFLDAVERFCRAGGGDIDDDTHVSTGSWEAALRGAGAGVDAIERLDAGEAD